MSIKDDLTRIFYEYHVPRNVFQLAQSYFPPPTPNDLGTAFFVFMDGLPWNIDFIEGAFIRWTLGQTLNTMISVCMEVKDTFLWFSIYRDVRCVYINQLSTVDDLRAFEQHVLAMTNEYYTVR